MMVRYLGPGLLTFGGDVLQTRNPRGVASLAVQHQACVELGQTARHRGADSGPCSRNDRNAQNPGPRGSLNTTRL